MLKREAKRYFRWSCWFCWLAGLLLMQHFIIKTTVKFQIQWFPSYLCQKYDNLQFFENTSPFSLRCRLIVLHVYNMDSDVTKSLSFNRENISYFFDRPWHAHSTRTACHERKSMATASAHVFMKEFDWVHADKRQSATMIETDTRTASAQLAHATSFELISTSKLLN